MHTYTRICTCIDRYKQIWADMCMLISATIFAVYAIRWHCKKCILHLYAVNIRAYMCISVHICLYLGISLFIWQHLTVNELKPECNVKALSLLNCTQPCNRPTHSVNIAVHIFHLKWYIFPKHVHICLYLSIHVHMRLYVCIDSLCPKLGRAWPVLVPVCIGGPPLRSASQATGSS